MSTIYNLAAELDTTGDVGATAQAMLGYLGHLTREELVGELAADAEADLRAVEW